MFLNPFYFFCRAARVQISGRTESVVFFVLNNHEHMTTCFNFYNTIHIYLITKQHNISVKILKDCFNIANNNQCNHCLLIALFCILLACLTIKNTLYKKTLKIKTELSLSQGQTNTTVVFATILCNYDIAAKEY